MPSPVGATVSISPFDYGQDDGPEPGDVLITYSERTCAYGTVYRVVGSRLMTRSVKPGRYSLRCQVLGTYDELAGRPLGGRPRFFTIVWSRRDRRRPR